MFHKVVILHAFKLSKSAFRLFFPAAGGRKRKATDSPASKKKEPPQKQRPIVHPRFKPGGSGADHTVRMMVQPSTPMEIDAIKKQDESESAKSKSATSASPGAGTPGTGGGQYNCSVCGVSASRLNVFILMCKCRYGFCIRNATLLTTPLL